ncbi:MAG: orotidine-5'-phosphate decarboxylase [Phycisphaerales bacterium]|nr:orotidine-5'-phosphate decarboxylase [Phycisphaerales bacterium]MDP6891407.1 orotidine-5'-phosphate decarboxylase [Phycisphaerales bacterium]
MIETRVGLDMPAKLAAAMRRAACNACVGLDPVLANVPVAIDRSDPIDAIRRFSLGVLEAVAPHVACLKVQSACYERYGAAGVAIIDEIMVASDLLDLPVILDAKRGDIGISAAHYASGVFDRAAAPDWVTVNAYLGVETLEPYLEHGGIFVLVRTSNPGSVRLQGLRLDDGRTIAEAMADMVAELAANRRNEQGWSNVGAVVGSTHPAEAESLRERMPGVILLVPGIGAQGGKVSDCAPLCGADCCGAVLAASRSVLYPEGQSSDWMQSIAEAAARFADETGRVAGLR